VSKLLYLTLIRQRSIALQRFCSPKSVAWWCALRSKALYDRLFVGVLSEKCARLPVANKNVHLCKFFSVLDFSQRNFYIYWRTKCFLAFYCNRWISEFLKNRSEMRLRQLDLR
jgi:hypothetical protein